MKKIIFLIPAFILAAYASQVTVTLEVTVTLTPTSTPVQTQTPMPSATPTITPIPTFSPETWDGMDQTARDIVLASLPDKSPEGYDKGGLGTVSDNLVKYYKADGTLGSVYNVETGTYLSPDEAGEVDLPTITLVNGAGENITIPEFGVDEFDKNIQYIADHVKWEEGDRNASLDAFGNNPELDIFLAQFEGVAGFIIKKHWSASSLPMESTTTAKEFFNLYMGVCGEGTLLIFPTKDEGFEAVYTDLEIKEFMNLKYISPIMSTLRP